jgi:sulfate permease, SulP family
MPPHLQLHTLFLGRYTSVLLVERAARPHTAELGRVPGTDVFSDIARNPRNERVAGALLARGEGGPPLLQR